MTTVKNRKASLSRRRYGASRAIRNISPSTGRGEEPKEKGFFNRHGEVVKRPGIG